MNKVIDIYDDSHYKGRKTNELFYKMFYKNRSPWNGQQDYVLEIVKDGSAWKSYDLFVFIDISTNRLVSLSLEKYENNYGFIPSVINGKKVKSLKRYAYETLDRCLDPKE